MSILSVHHLSKSYNKRTVVADVSLSLQSGEIVGLIGPNGAGKTTSFHMIIGLVACDSGTICLDGKDITMLPIDRRARHGLGYLPQEASVFRKLTVAENIMAILELQRHLDCATMRRKLEDLLAEFNIAHLADSFGMVLSGGERRRVEIARALATEPSFLLLDEPFAGVDPLSVGDIKNLIKQLVERKIGVLITDHNVRDTLSVCNRTYIVNNGKIIAAGTVEQIIENEQVREVYLGKEFSL